MANSIKDAFRRAGQKPNKKPKADSHKSRPPNKEKDLEKHATSNKGRRYEAAPAPKDIPWQKTRHAKHQGGQKKNPVSKVERKRLAIVDVAAYAKHLGETYGSAARKITSTHNQVKDNGFRVRVVGKPALNPVFEQQRISHARLVSELDGIRGQIAAADAQKTDELVIGLDFGTSSVKVVIGDRNRDRAFAVPFLDPKSSDNPYIWPSTLWVSGECYSLDGGDRAIRDLKLRFLSETAEPKVFEQAAAFLGLVIRHARGWYLTTHEDIYLKAGILWNFNLGIPAQSYDKKPLVDQYRRLAIAAMAVAALPEKYLSIRAVDRLCTEIRNQKPDQHGDFISSYCADAQDIDVIPEVTAQIYGFVQSDQFDPGDKNIFMLVDVGAGTVDSSIFHVVREDRGKWGFHFFSTCVEQNGTVPLHRYRADWLMNVPDLHNDQDLLTKLSSIRQPADFQTGYPESIDQYVLNVEFRFDSPESNPDNKFYSDRLWKQVFVKTLDLPVREKKLDTFADLSDPLPLFLCGGGSRMQFYNRLVDGLNSRRGQSWGKVKQRQLRIPRKLQVHMPKRKDYDRLSVAFGLSFMKLGTYARSVDIPALTHAPGRDEQTDFVSKDMV